MSGSTVRTHLAAWLGCLVIALFVVVALLGDAITPQDPLQQNLAGSFIAPLQSSADHFHVLGTDGLGRDVLSRIMVGTQPMLKIVVLSTLLSGAAGLAYGMAAAFAPRPVEQLMLRFIDVQLAIPTFILAILLAIVIGPGIGSSVLAVTVTSWPTYARLVRADAAKLRTMPFVLSARVAGLSWARILVKHVVRNVLPMFVVLLTFNIGTTIIFASSLSFLGYGIQPPQPDWGNMLGDGAKYLNFWWLATIPGLAILVLTLACNAVGEDIRRRVSSPGLTAVGAESAVLGSALTSSRLARRGRRTRGAGHDLVDDAAPTDEPSATRDGDLAAEVRGLTVAVAGRGRRIIRDVDLQVRHGERFAIVGESGSGKSTVCLSLLGMIPDGLDKVAGRVTVHGHDMTTASARTLSTVRGRIIGAVFQDPMASLNPVRTVGWQVGEARRRHRLGAARDVRGWVTDMLTTLGFTDPDRVARSYPHELSGGMRQRACIAIAVSAEPRVILADEPTTALDMSVRGQVLRQLLARCEAEDLTLLLVSHDIWVVRAVSTRVAVMFGGRVLEEGPTQAVLDAPRSPYTRGLIASSITLDPERRDQPLPTLTDDSHPGDLRRGDGCPFAHACPRAIDTCADLFPPETLLTSGQPGQDRRVWCWNPVE